MGERMSIGRDDVLHVAKLAELAVHDGDLDRIVGQLNRIVDFVAQLDQVPADGSADLFLPGPSEAALREDVPGPVPLARPPAELAPEFADGFFLVPRHGAMEDL
jgi:aspartyl-tRNA(Asn)/glutamyl-tRNA(Gln) amidotransferase subunit C